MQCQLLSRIDNFDEANLACVGNIQFIACQPFVEKPDAARECSSGRCTDKISNVVWCDHLKELRENREINPLPLYRKRQLCRQCRVRAMARREHGPCGGVDGMVTLRDRGQVRW
jgi:hypothetical protein